MRIQTSETLATPDAEMVLRVLEHSLRDISVEVIREGRQITLRGLGPSQRTMNRKDITVLEVMTENEQTTISADITFMASALIGEAPQDEIVRSKLERVFDRVKLELGTRSVRGVAPAAPDEPLPAFMPPPIAPEPIVQHAPPVEPIAEPIPMPEAVPEAVPVPIFAAPIAAPEPVPPVEVVPSVEPVSAIRPVHMPETVSNVEAVPTASPVDPSKRVHWPKPVNASTPVRPVSSVRPVEPVRPISSVRPVVPAKPAGASKPAVASQAIPAAQRTGASRPERIVAAAVTPGAASRAPQVNVSREKTRPAGSSSPLVPKQSEEEPEFRLFGAMQPEDPERRRPRAIIVAVACAIVAALMYLGWPYLTGLMDKGTTSSGPTSVQTVGGATVAQQPNAARSPYVHDEADPKVWIESWAAAMRSRDAALQASFYANPVDHYALRSHVRYADVLADKQRSIRNRSELWTFKAERVIAEQRSDGTVRVRLVKHVISNASGEEVSEAFIRSQLRLKRIDGQWKITSEQNLSEEE